MHVSFKLFFLTLLNHFNDLCISFPLTAAKVSIKDSLKRLHASGELWPASQHQGVKRAHPPLRYGNVLFHQAQPIKCTQKLIQLIKLTKFAPNFSTELHRQPHPRPLIEHLSYSYTYRGRC